MPTTKFFGVVQSANQKGNLVTQIKVPRKYPVGQHNNTTAWICGGTGSTYTVTDDKVGVWTKQQDISRGDQMQFWTRVDVTDGFDTLIVNVSGAGEDYVTAGWGEACGVGALDTAPGTWAASGTSTTPKAGSKTPTNGSLIIAACHQDSSGVLLTSVAIDAGFTQMTAPLDPLSFLYNGSKLHTTGAINPGFTFNTSRGWTCAAIAWLPDTSKGTAPPATAFIDAATHYCFDTSAFTTPFKIQLPSIDATGLGLLFENSPGPAITSITDDAGNTWVQTLALSNGAGGTNELWYCKAPAAGSNTLLVTVNFTGSAAGCMISALKFTGSDQATGTGATSSTTGNDAVSTSIVGASITPTTANGLVISLFGVESQTVTAVNNTGFWSCVSTPTIASPAPLMENNGYGLKYSPAGAIQNTWTMDGAPQHWQEIQVEILSASSGAASSPGSSAGTSTVAGIGSSIAVSSGAAAGSGVASAAGTSIATSPGSAAGVGTAGAVGSSIAIAVGSSAGIATVQGFSGAGVSTGAGASSGLSVATAVGLSLATAAGSSTGTSTANAAGSPTTDGLMGAAAGQAQVAAVGFSIVIAAGLSHGIGTALGSSVFIQRLTVALSESVVTRLALSESLV